MLFSRVTKTRVASMQATEPVCEYFTAHPARLRCAPTQALNITWTADDGKKYSICLYGDEVTNFNKNLFSNHKLS